MPDESECYGYEAERVRLRREWEALEAERAGLGDLPTGPVDPAHRQQEIDAAMDAIEYEIGMLDQREKAAPEQQPAGHGGWAATGPTQQLAEGIRKAFCKAAGRDVTLEELTAAMDAMRAELGERRVSEDEALRLVMAKLKSP